MSRISLVIQWLRICTSIAAGTGSIFNWGMKVLHGALKKKKKRFLGIPFSVVHNYSGKFEERLERNLPCSGGIVGTQHSL